MQGILYVTPVLTDTSNGLSLIIDRLTPEIKLANYHDAQHSCTKDRHFYNTQEPSDCGINAFHLLPACVVVELLDKLIFGVCGR